MGVKSGPGPSLDGRALRDEDSTGDSGVESHKLRLILAGQLQQVAVSQFGGCLRKSGQPIGTEIVAEQFERDRAGLFQLLQRLAGSGNIRLKPSLDGNPHESQFRNSAGAQAMPRTPVRLIPRDHARVMNMGPVGERDQRIDVEKVIHGNSAKAART